MQLSEIQTKGLAKLLVAPGIVPDKLRMHISTVEPGQRAHAAHTHPGVEVFYVLEGQATVEVEDEQYALDVNQATVINASVPHGIINSGATPVRYVVIISSYAKERQNAKSG